MKDLRSECREVCRSLRRRNAEEVNARRYAGPDPKHARPDAWAAAGVAAGLSRRADAGPSRRAGGPGRPGRPWSAGWKCAAIHCWPAASFASYT